MSTIKINYLLNQTNDSINFLQYIDIIVRWALLIAYKAHNQEASNVDDKKSTPKSKKDGL